MVSTILVPPSEAISSTPTAQKEPRFTIQCANDETPSLLDDGTMLDHWKRAWQNAGNSMDDDETTEDDTVSEFLETNRSQHQLKTFCAVDTDTGKVVGFLHGQIWSGPVPIEVIAPDVFRLGTVWGLHVDAPSSHEKEIVKALTEAALEYLHSLQCKKVVTWALTEKEKELLMRSGFCSGNMLTLDLTTELAPTLTTALVDVEFEQVGSSNTDSNEIVANHWRRMWIDCGIPDSALSSDLKSITADFIAKAERYQTFLAKNKHGDVIGSLSCQVWKGPIPQVATLHHKVGTIWAVYVHPEYRCRGIATTLMQMATRYLQDDVGCQEAILIAASQQGERVYRSLGFAPNRALVYDYPTTQKPENESDKALQNTSEAGADTELTFKGIHQGNHRIKTALETATTRQLLAVYENHPQRNTILKVVADHQKKERHDGGYIDPQDNWFTQNLHRFGKGFDLKQLANDEAKLARKFDRLAETYDHWTVGNQSLVEGFIVQCFERYLRGSSSNVKILDVACGIGLQGQVVRLLGFEGVLVGCDVSSQMVQRVVERGCYNDAYVTNANTKLLRSSDPVGSYHVVICTGAMELLEHNHVLPIMRDALDENGLLWVSFQLASSATAHQSVTGLDEVAIVQLLERHGFRVLSTRACANAFYTPSPKQDGSLLPVPYLFVVAQKTP